MNTSIYHPRAHLLSRSRTLPQKSSAFSCSSTAAAPLPPPRQFLGNNNSSNLCRLLPYKIQRRQQRNTTPVTAASAPAATAAAAAATTDTIFGRAYTGVPLMELYKSMTLADVALESFLRIAFIVTAVFFGNKIIPFIGSKVEAALGKLGKHNHTKKRPGIFAQLIGSLVAAAETPCRALLPWFGFAYVSTVLSVFGEVVVERLGTAGAAGAAGAANAMSKATAKVWMNAAGMKVFEVLRDTAQLMQDAYEVVAIIFAAWLFINLKNQLVKNIMTNTASSSSDSSMDDDGIARIVLPVSTLITWGVVVATILVSLTAVGIDVKPLLALGSVSGLAIGFAAQSTVANVVSAFSLYTSRPFIAGDRVQLKTMTGANVVTGTIDKILPLHTILKTDNGTPIFIHNKDVAGTLLVVNESRILHSRSTPQIPTLDTTITVRYQDIDKVGAIQKETTEWMQAHPDMMPGASCKCSLQGFDTMGAVLSIKATLKRDAASRKAQVFTDILLFAENTVRRNGGYLAMNPEVAMPPPLTE